MTPSNDAAATIREIVLDLLADGNPKPRAAILHAVAEYRGIHAEKRPLRAEVAREIRNLEAEGVLIDGGPEVWLANAR